MVVSACAIARSSRSSSFEVDGATPDAGVGACACSYPLGVSSVVDICQHTLRKRRVFQRRWLVQRPVNTDEHHAFRAYPNNPLTVQRMKPEDVRAQRRCAPTNLLLRQGIPDRHLLPMTLDPHNDLGMWGFRPVRAAGLHCVVCN